MVEVLTGMKINESLLRLNLLCNRNHSQFRKPKLALCLRNLQKQGASSDGGKSRLELRKNLKNLLEFRINLLR